MKSKHTLRNYLLLGSSSLLMLTSAHAATIIGFEAEDGSVPFSTAGSTGWRLESDASALGGQNIYTEVEVFNDPSLPGDEDHVASYNITFAVADTYDLYARVMRPTSRMQANTFYFDETFGAPDSNNWQQVSLSDTEAPLDTYVWINLSAKTGDTFTVAAPNTLQFNLGARERRLRMDAFAFGTTADRATITDTDLSNAVLNVIPEPSSTALLGLGGLALILRRRR
jgi:hypothetical protein